MCVHTPVKLKQNSDISVQKYIWHANQTISDTRITYNHLWDTQEGKQHVHLHKLKLEHTKNFMLENPSRLARLWARLTALSL